MPSAVVDASTLVDLFIGSPAAGAIFERIFRQRTVLHAPHSIDVEVANAIRRDAALARSPAHAARIEYIA